LFKNNRLCSRLTAARQPLAAARIFLPVFFSNKKALKKRALVAKFSYLTKVY